MLFIVLDDTGYAQFGSYGTPMKTLNLDDLAENGLRKNNMHNYLGTHRIDVTLAGRADLPDRVDVADWHLFLYLVHAVLLNLGVYDQCLYPGVELSL